jgi:Transcription factor TFIID complex subunit 8 C-term
MEAALDGLLSPKNVSAQMSLKSEKARGKERAKDDELPDWANPDLGFLAPDGPLLSVTRVASDAEEDDLADVQALSSLKEMLKDPGTSHLPALPPRYTFVHTPVYSKSDSLPSIVASTADASSVPTLEQSTSRTNASAASGSFKSLESVERKWTHSQLTQSSLKGLIKRVDAAQAGLYNAVAEAVYAEAVERQAQREREQVAQRQTTRTDNSALQRQGSTSIEESFPRRAKRERADSEAGPIGAAEKKRAKIILSRNREVSPHSSSGSGTPSAMSPPPQGLPDPASVLALTGPSSMGPPPTTSITAAGGPGPPRRSISLSLKREGRPNLSVVSTPSIASPTAGASSNTAPSPGPQGLSTTRTGNKISLKLRTSSAATAAPSGAQSSSTIGARVTSQPASSAPLTPRTPLAALYSPGAAKLGLGIGMGLPSRDTVGSTSGPNGGDGYFSRIHSALQSSRRSTVSSGFDTSSQFADLSSLSRTVFFAFPGASSRTVSGDSFGSVPPTPATPFPSSAHASGGYAYPPTPVEAHHPMGGASWRASIFVGAREGGSPFSFPPPSPLPSDVVEGIRSRAASISTPAPAETAAQAGNTTSQTEVQQSAAALLEGLASLPGVVNYKNALTRRVRPVA